MTEPVAPTLDVAGLVVRFGGIVALDDVTFRIEPGQVVGIIGPNGAGKTTLFNAICGFIRPDAGLITYRGRPLLGTAPHRLARLGIARTLQGLGLWPGLSVRENVMLGARTPRRFWGSLLASPASSRRERDLADQAVRLLDELGIGAAADAGPAALPYGVQKRVVIARALMANPSLLLLDEPASGLSSSEIDALAGLLRRLRQRMSVAVVEHHLDLVMATSDTVVVLNLGRVIAAGRPEEIRRDPAVATAYLGEEVPGTEAAGA